MASGKNNKNFSSQKKTSFTFEKDFKYILNIKTMSEGQDGPLACEMFIKTLVT